MHAPSNALLQVEWVPLSALEALVPQWQDLLARALEPNVFYDPAFALAAAPEFGRDVGVSLAWSASGHRLVGMFPARIEGIRRGAPWPRLIGWTHAFAPLGTPLVDRDLAEPVIAAWLDHAARDAALPNFILLPLLPETGPFAAALDAVLRRSERRSAVFARHERALLAPAGPDPGYVEHALGSEKRRKLRRQQQRLAERGAVQFVSATRPAEVADALASFLALEASGWKGRAGTAAAMSDTSRRFMTHAVVALAGEGKASIHRLMVGGRAIAAGIVLRSGDTAWFWKIAYDETFARFSPGVLLGAEVTKTLAAGGDIARADSCAPPGHPMIDHLWRERLPLSDRLIAVAGSASSFALACRLETARRTIFAAARRLRDRLRRR